MELNKIPNDELYKIYELIQGNLHKLAVELLKYYYPFEYTSEGLKLGTTTIFWENITIDKEYIEYLIIRYKIE